MGFRRFTPLQPIATLCEPKQEVLVGWPTMAHKGGVVLGGTWDPWRGWGYQLECTAKKTKKAALQLRSENDITMITPPRS